MSGAVSTFDEYEPDTISDSYARRMNPEVDFQPRRKSSLEEMVEGLPSKLPAMAAEKAEYLKQKRAADEAVFGRTNERIEEDRARMIKAQDAMGVEAEKLQPWDADAMREKFRTDPIASFGSLGSVFAMIASAFTHAPMTNALNASAAAMMAIKDGNEAEYEKAFKAFKENNDLVLKRHGMMNQAYQNAATLMDKDISAGKIALLENATRFGDQNLAVMLNNGMDKEALDYVQSFGKMTRDAAEIGMYMDDVAFRQNALQQARKQNSQITDPRMRQLMDELAYNRITRGKEISPQQLMTESIIAQNPNIGYEQLGNLLKQYNLVGRGPGSSAREREMEPFKSQVRNEHPDWSDDEIAIEANKRYTESTTRANYGPTAQREKAYREQVVKEHPDWSPGQVQAEVDKRMKQAQTVMTANKADDLRKQTDKVQRAIEMIDKVESTIQKRLGPVGAYGYANRLKERVGNLVGGSKSTDYVQVSRDIDTLKLWATDNLLDRGGKPLSAEHGQINNIIAGMHIGDTTENTLRAYRDLRALYKRMQARTIERLEGTWEPPTAPAKPSTAKETNENRSRKPWLDAPLANPQ